MSRRIAFLQDHHDKTGGVLMPLDGLQPILFGSHRLICRNV